MPLVVRPNTEEWMCIGGAVFVKVVVEKDGKPKVIFDAASDIPIYRQHTASRRGVNIDWPPSILEDPERIPPHLRNGVST